MQRLEKIVFWTVISLLVGVLALHKSLTWIEGQTDNVYVVEIIDNIAHRGLPLTKVHASVAQSVRLWSMTAEEICRQALKLPQQREFNYFRWHPYVILYAIAPLAWVLPAPFLIATLIVISFVGLLAAAYWMLRQRGVNPLCSLAFCALVMAHPAWYQAIQGQVYPDRLFLLPAMMLLIALFSPQPRISGIVLFGTLALLVTERTGIICGAFLLGATILYSRRLANLRWKTILLSITFILYSVVLFKFYLDHYATASFSSTFHWSSIKSNLHNPVFADGLVAFFIVNFALLGLFSLFEWRGLLLTLGMMVPNILGNIGGAEKTGWLTHYHTMYFPFLVWASLEGYAKVYAFSTRRARAPRVLLLVAALALTALSATMVPSVSYRKLTFNRDHYTQSPLYRAIKETPAFLGSTATRPYLKDIIPLIHQTIPKGSTVSTFEGMMPSLYGWADLIYYPDGITESDYVIVLVEKDQAGKTVYGGQVSFLGPTEYAKISSCLTERLRMAGYTTDSPVLLGSSGMAILKREPATAGPRTDVRPNPPARPTGA